MGYLPDNKSSLPRSSQASIDFHFLQERVAAAGALEARFIAMDYQLADVFTKPSTPQIFFR